MLAVATTEDQLEDVRSSLLAIGARPVDLVTPGPERLIVLATVANDQESESAATVLRSAGLMAVTRPESGARLAAWRRDTAPVAFGPRLSVCLAWSEHDRGGLPNLIELGPGGFGSGHHPTTRMIIENLVASLSGGERVLDVGCGSGILALAAVALGAGSATGIDLKSDAIRATRHNAILNGLSERIEATDVALDTVEGPFDVVLANIARAGIVALAGELVGQVADGGRLVLSGITPRQCEQVAGFLSPLHEVERRTDGEWALLVLRRSTAARA